MERVRGQWVNRMALMALFGLVLQILTPFAQAVSYVNDDDGLTGRVVICTAYGVKTIDLSTGTEIPDDKDAPGGQAGSNVCIICLAYAALSSSARDDCNGEYLQPPAQIFAFSRLPEDSLPHLQPGNRAHSVRAPPAG